MSRSKREWQDTERLLSALRANGISDQDAVALRRISMTLHRWHELECGTDRWYIERHEETGKPWLVSSRTDHREPTADREAGALRRLKTIMARYPQLRAYVQTDPRGASLFILRPGDVPAGESDDAYYSRGIAVYR